MEPPTRTRTRKIFIITSLNLTEISVLLQQSRCRRQASSPPPVPWPLTGIQPAMPPRLPPSYQKAQRRARCSPAQQVKSMNGERFMSLFYVKIFDFADTELCMKLSLNSDQIFSLNTTLTTTFLLILMFYKLCQSQKPLPFLCEVWTWQQNSFWIPETV